MLIINVYFPTKNVNTPLRERLRPLTISLIAVVFTAVYRIPCERLSFLHCDFGRLLRMAATCAASLFVYGSHLRL